MKGSDPARQVLAMLREIEQKIEAGMDVTDDLPDLLHSIRLALESSLRSEEEMRERCERLLAHQTLLDERLLRVERNRLFRVWNTVSLKAIQLCRRASQMRLLSPVHRLLPCRQPGAGEYVRWVNHEQAALPSVAEHRAVAEGWRRRPLISIIMPISRADDRWLAEAAASVRAQSYEKWQLCIAADGPQRGPVMRLIEDSMMQDPRIQFTALPEKEGIGAASNAASGMAEGEYLGFLDQDDVLSPFALHHVVESIQDAAFDLIYSDEDQLDSTNTRVQPLFKPGWSPTLLLSCMYIGRFLVVRREAFEGVGGFRSQFDGAQDHDLALRITAQYPSIHHIPRVLYHQRIHESPASAFAAKALAPEAGRLAVHEATARSGPAGAQITTGKTASTYRVRWPVPDGSAVSIIVCSKTARLLERCIESVRNSVRGMGIEVLVVHHEDGEPDREMRRALVQLGAKVVPFRGAFHFSRMNNAGAAQASAPYLLFLNDDVYATGDGWCERLVGQLRQPEVGIAGAVLRYLGGALQHAGIVLGIGDGAGHPGRFRFASELWPWLTLTREVSAVTGACMAARADVFHQLGGFDPVFPNNYNDVDLCLRAASAGYRVVCVAADELVHEECGTRLGLTHLGEREAFYERWMEILRRPDPYYSQSLRAAEEIALNGPGGTRLLSLWPPPARVCPKGPQ
jgi:GT2 family glycosyltransferase